MLKTLQILTLTISVVLFTAMLYQNSWISIKQKGYSVMYTKADNAHISEYLPFFEDGKSTVEGFFQTPFSSYFHIYIHPTRTSLDNTWQKDWNLPSFTSECWMVASGTAKKLDVISPKKWDSLACEHSYVQRLKVKRLLTHELVHVYHGQKNTSPDFSETMGIDWFVEGLAVYVSGQLDSDRLNRLKTFLKNNPGSPPTLNHFWKGKNKYGLSGSMVKYIDKKYGRDKLYELLSYNTLDSLLSSLNISEIRLIQQWKRSLLESK